MKSITNLNVARYVTLLQPNAQRGIYITHKYFQIQQRLRGVILNGLLILFEILFVANRNKSMKIARERIKNYQKCP